MPTQITILCDNVETPIEYFEIVAENLSKVEALALIEKIRELSSELESYTGNQCNP